MQTSTRTSRYRANSIGGFGARRCATSTPSTRSATSWRGSSAFRTTEPPLAEGYRRCRPRRNIQSVRLATATSVPCDCANSERRARGIDWTNEQHSRDDWPRAWRWIGPLFAGADPKLVTPEQLIDPDLPGLRPLVASKVSESEAHRVIKVWRALWRRMAGFGYCDAARDPSFQFANTAPRPRQAVWSEGETIRLVKQSWRSEYHGLAALLATAWDSQLSPVDVRGLKVSQRRRDAAGTWFAVDRAKTGRAALATLSKRAEYVLDAYLAQLRTELVGPIFRNRSGRPYSKDTLGDDFRDVRALVFGAKENRTLADFRRSGSVEALAGNVPPEKLSAIDPATPRAAASLPNRARGPILCVSQ